MTDRSAINRLLAHPKWGNGIALERFDRLLDALDLKPWLNTIDAIKITGSNGKGTVALFTSALLQHLSFSTGTYTSPHLFRLNERITLNGTSVDDSLLNQQLGHVFDQLSQLNLSAPEESFGGFEILTAAALLCFQTSDPDVLVIEAGVGGRYDITRLIPGKTTALTSIDLEHTQLLGSTRELILYDKSDLCPSGGHLFVGELDAPLRRKLDVYASLRDVTVEHVVPQDDPVLSAPTPSVLQHNRANATLSLRLCEDWMKRHSIVPKPSDFNQRALKALAETRLPLRCEKIDENPSIFADVAHTPAALRRAIEMVRSLTGKTPIVVLGIGIAKDWERIGDALAGLQLTHIHFVEDHATFVAPDKLADIFAQTTIPPELKIMPTMSGAFESAARSAQEKRLPVLITGSHLIAVSAYCHFTGMASSDLDRY